jgi:hypothetical protein
MTVFLPLPTKGMSTTISMTSNLLDFISPDRTATLTYSIGSILCHSSPQNRTVLPESILSAGFNNLTRGVSSDSLVVTFQGKPTFNLVPSGMLNSNNHFGDVVSRCWTCHRRTIGIVSCRRRTMGLVSSPDCECDDFKKRYFQGLIFMQYGQR